MKRVALILLLFVGCARSSTGCSEGLSSDPVSDMAVPGGDGANGGSGGTDMSMCPEGQLLCDNGCHECCTSDDCGLDLCRFPEQRCEGPPDGGLTPTSVCATYQRVCPGQTPVCADCCGDGDCGSGVCIQGLCYANSCRNGGQDLDETDIDCGGVCAKCDGGRHCKVFSDCASARCDSGTCVGVVSTGAHCPAGSHDCAVRCAAECCVGSDCTSGVCSERGYCLPWYCADGELDGFESDVDCGRRCNLCPLGAKCHDFSDCENGYCDATSHCTLPVSRPSP